MKIIVLILCMILFFYSFSFSQSTRTLRYCDFYAVQISTNNMSEIDNIIIHDVEKNSRINRILIIGLLILYFI